MLCGISRLRSGNPATLLGQQTMYSSFNIMPVYDEGEDKDEV